MGRSHNQKGQIGVVADQHVGLVNHGLVEIGVAIEDCNQRHRRAETTGLIHNSDVRYPGHSFLPNVADPCMRSGRCRGGKAKHYRAVRGANLPKPVFGTLFASSKSLLSTGGIVCDLQSCLANSRDVRLRVAPNTHLPIGPVCSHGLVVGYEHDSSAGFGRRFCQEFHGVGLGNRVEPGSGFVGEKDRGGDG